MKKSLKRVGVIAGAIATAMLATPKTQATATPQAQEQKAARIEKSAKKSHTIQNHYSGLDVVTINPGPGLSPKEYGLRYGNGKSRKSKTNFNRLSHNAKIARA